MLPVYCVFPATKQIQQNDMWKGFLKPDFDCWEFITTVCPVIPQSHFSISLFLFLSSVQPFISLHLKSFISTRLSKADGLE